MQRNMICTCGAQVRAEIRELTTRGIVCPNCGYIVRLEVAAKPSGGSGVAGAISLDPANYEAGEQKPGAIQGGSVLESIVPAGSLQESWVFAAGVTFLAVGMMLLMIYSLDKSKIFKKLVLASPNTAKSANQTRPASRQPKVAWEDFNAWESLPATSKSTNSAIEIANEFCGFAIRSEYEKCITVFRSKVISDMVQYGQDVGITEKTEDRKQAGARKLVGILIRDFFDNSQAITMGYHDWRVIGYSSASDEIAVLLRYYREDQTPADFISTEEMIPQIASLISFDDFSANYRPLFTTKSLKIEATMKRGIKLKDFYASKNYGYIVLVFSESRGFPALINLIEWQTNQSLQQFCRSQMAIEVEDPKWITKKTESSEDEQSRIALDINAITSIQSWLSSAQGETPVLTRGKIADAIDLISKQTNDPLMLDLRARVAVEQDNRIIAQQSFLEAQEKGFQSLAAFKYFILQNADRGDGESLGELMKKLTDYWQVKATGLDAREDRNNYLQFEKSLRQRQ
jgi:hypothetical protein